METLKFLMISTHFSPYKMGGDAIMVEYLCQELLKRGHEVHVFDNPAVHRLLRKLPSDAKRETVNDGVIRHEYSSKTPGKLEVLITLAANTTSGKRRTLTELVADVKPDVVHWHNTKGFIGRPLPVSAPRALYTAHDYYLVCPRSNLLRPDLSLCECPRQCQLCLVRWKKPPQLWRIGKNRLIQVPNGTQVLAPSRFMADRLRREGIPEAQVLRNFVPRQEIQSEYPWSERTSIIYIGILEQHKGPQTLVEAFSKCNDRQGFDLQIIGGGSLQQQLTIRIRELGLENRIKMRGYVSQSDLKETLGRAAAVVIPSEWHENAPLVALEAFSKGIPVLGSDLGGLPEILGPDSGSMTFKGGDADDLPNHLVMLWEKREQLSAMSKRAREAYEKRFSPEVHLAQYLKIIQAV